MKGNRESKSAYITTKNQSVKCKIHFTAPASHYNPPIIPCILFITNFMKRNFKSIVEFGGTSWDEFMRGWRETGATLQGKTNNRSKYARTRYAPPARVPPPFWTSSAATLTTSWCVFQPKILVTSRPSDIHHGEHSF